MFFQVNISPVKPVPKCPVPEIKEEIAVLTLAPFATNPKIFFEDVKVGNVAVQKIIIKNPSPKNIKLYLTKASPEERMVNYNWTEQVLRPESETLFEITWSPCIDGAWRDIFIFEDGYRIKKEIPVTFKSISTKKPIKPRKKCVAISQKVKSPTKKVKSPKKTVVIRKQKSPVKKFVSPRTNNKAYSPHKQIMQNNSPLQKFVSPRTSKKVYSPQKQIMQSNSHHLNPNSYSPQRRSTFSVKDKENYIPISNNATHIVPSITFTVEDKIDVSPWKSPVKNFNNSNNFDDSLELVGGSPLLKSNQLHTPLLASFRSNTNLHHNPVTPLNLNSFSPDVCSTGQRSTNSTFDFINAHNISAETYVKGNTSGDTYVKGNLSAGTYVKDDSVANLAALQESPVFPERTKPVFNISPIPVESAKSIIEANMWSRDNNRALDIITEESFLPISSGSDQDTPKCNGRKRKSNYPVNYSPPKKSFNSTFSPPKRHSFNQTGRVREKSVNWTSKPKGLNLKEFIEKRKVKEVKVTVLHNPDSFLNAISNPYVLANTDNIDPFMSATLFYDPRWMDEQEVRFKKWLNVLLTPPDELSVNADSHPTDVAKLWQECKKRVVDKAPTKEQVSNKLHVSRVLDSLRRNAVNLFRSSEVTQPLSKCVMMVDSGKILIRKDKNVHLDLGIQYVIMSLFLSYNPLWLRVGLETIFGVTIRLHSNSDLVGLSTFIMGHFFKDTYLYGKYKGVHADKYVVEIKKHMLKKFLMFVYFVDHAKLKKLIPYDPCLFCKNAPYKESREVLLKFSSECLSAMGDLTKVLRLTGYVLSHKQTFIHEFEYAVENLGVDLRDGIRLTKVMEIILLEENLTKYLRVPPISRLQKIHNTKIVFDSLQKAQYNILHDIQPKDIVEGHREKTLSFLWQIIHKFQAPRFLKAVVSVQHWWRCLQSVIKRRILSRERLKRHNAASVIQKWYLRQIARAKIERIIPIINLYIMNQRQNRAAVKIQSFYKMYTQRKVYLQIKYSVILLQKYARKWLVKFNIQRRLYAAIKIQSFVRSCLARKRFVRCKLAVICIEEKYLATKLMWLQFERYNKLVHSTIFIQQMFRANLHMKQCKQAYELQKSAALAIQRRFRAKIAMQKDLRAYQTLKQSVLVVESRYLAKKAMCVQRNLYLQQINAALIIQRSFKATKAMQLQRFEYLNLKEKVVYVQNKFRANCIMKICKNKYELQKRTALIIQRRFRAKLAMRREFLAYRNLKKSVLFIENIYLAIKTMKVQRKLYLQQIDAAIVIQRYFRATKAMQLQRQQYLNLLEKLVYIQRKFRANRAMKDCKKNYILQKNAACVLQRRFRANLAMKKDLIAFKNLKKSVLFVENLYLANKAMKAQRRMYLLQMNAALVIQRRFRATKAMQLQRHQYLNIKDKVVYVQNKFRANCMMKICKNRYTLQKRSVLTIQRRFRAKLAMHRDFRAYKNLKKSVLFIENLYLAIKSMRAQRKLYLQQIDAAVVIQRHFRATKAMQLQRQQYLNLLEKVVNIQRRFRANCAMKDCKKNYILQKNAACVIQRRFRANLAMKKDLIAFKNLKKSVLFIENLYLANKSMKEQRKIYLLQINATLVIQRRFKATKTMQLQRHQYLNMKQKVVYVQNKFRANSMMKICKNRYELQKRSALIIQRRFRAKLAMRKEFQAYKNLKKSVLFIENLYLSIKTMKAQRKQYLQQIDAAVVIQRHFRATKAMQLQRQQFIHLLEKVVNIQRRFRANCAMKDCKKNYILQKNAACVIQRRFRANLAMKKDLIAFKNLKKSVLFIENLYLANKSMKEQRKMYLLQINATLVIQRRFKATKTMQLQRHQYLNMKQKVVYIQNKFRANCMMKICKNSYELQKRSALIIQRRFRAKLAMHKEYQAYTNLKKSVLFIENLYLATKAMNIQRKLYVKQTNAISVIQLYFRATKAMQLQKQQYLKIKNNVIFLQQKFRANCMMKVCKNNYELQKRAALIIQRRFRAKLAMQKEVKAYQNMKKSVLFIENLYIANKAMHAQRQQYLKLINAALVIQRCFTANKMMYLERHKYLNLKEKVVCVQRIFRAKLARLQDPVEIERRRVNQLRRSSATKIQAVWRGFRIRSVEKPEVTQIRRRCIIAEKNKNPEKTLECRQNQALKIIFSEYSSWLQIVRALEDIEYVIRRCKSTCVTMSKTLSENLVITINSVGRSLPDMQACVAATSILISFCKYPESSPNTWCPELMDGMFKTMLHWCDNDSLVFPYLCTLVWLYAHNKKQARYIMSMPNLEQNLQKMNALCERKQKMVARGAPKRQSMFAAYTNLPLPALKPDWGLDFKDKPRTFINSVHSIKSLLAILKCNK